MKAPRNALFISHANPEDNSFTMWLGSRLSAAGYDVWADILKLHGGNDWQRKLEDALRNKALKVLLVGTAHGIDKQGVRNEIQIAHNISKKIADSEFIIPLRLESFEAPFLIAHAQYINFEESWANGLAELLETLETEYNVPRIGADASISSDYWRDIHTRHSRAVVDSTETLVTNWLEILALPKTLYLLDFSAGIRVGAAKKQMNTAPWPLVPYKRGFISFAPLHDLQDHFGPNLPLVTVDSTEVEDFHEDGWLEQGIQRFDGLNMLTNLLRQAVETKFKERNLTAFSMSSYSCAWWPNIEVAPIKQIPFQFSNGWKGSRQITGYSEKRELYWHFGVTPKPRLFPLPHIKLITRVIFSEDGFTALDNPRKMHRYRRSFTKGWRNPKWRDMLLAFINWLAQGDEELLLPVSSTESVRLQIPPLGTEVPIALATADDAAADESDSEDELYDDDGPLTFDAEFDEIRDLTEEGRVNDGQS